MKYIAQYHLHKFKTDHKTTLYISQTNENPGCPRTQITHIQVGVYEDGRGMGGQEG